MRIYGIDFTSSPSLKKPITCAVCGLSGGVLTFLSLQALPDFRAFEAFLRSEGPWVAGLDFPFAQSRTFIDNIMWPKNWAECVSHVATFERQQFIVELENYKRDRPPGNKEHNRKFETSIGAKSPQKLYGVPVGKMYFEGARRLLEAKVHIPGLAAGDTTRICVEAYPGILVERLTGQRGYKADARRKQTELHLDARLRIFAAITGEAGLACYGLSVVAPDSLCDDPTGDRLDALLCAVQAAWAHRSGYTETGPRWADPLEGWIADPAACPED